MGAKFLLVATEGGSSQQRWELVGPMLVLLIIVLLVLAICVGVLTHFARRRLIDAPTAAKLHEFADPWTEAGKRIAEPSKGPRPSGPPPSSDVEDGDAP